MCLILFVVKFSSCSDAIDSTKNLYEINEPYLKLEPEEYYDRAYEFCNYPAYVTTKRIGESLPYFTFTRILGDYLDDSLIYQFPLPVEVTIVIKDDEGTVVQVISGLSQSRSFIDSNITFDDYNFDGYLDMRLLRWQEGAFQLNTTNYFWLWDIEKSQFIINEQLTKIMGFTEINTNQETRQIEAWLRKNVYGGMFYYFAYYNEMYILISSKFRKW